MRKPTPQLDQLADACWDGGACNAGGIIRSLGRAVDELEFGQAREHPALPMILGQLGYLLGEMPGPSDRAVDNWVKYCQERTAERAAAIPLIAAAPVQV